MIIDSKKTSQVPLAFRVEPWPHQLRSIEAFSERQFFALLYRMGRGKTGAAINCIRLKCSQGRRVLSVLILCPLVVVENWKREIGAHAGSAIVNAVQTLEGTEKERRAQIKDSPAKIFITNFQSIHMKCLWNDISRRAWDFLVVDEAHRCKGHKSKQTKKLIALADRTRFKMILTGTPVVNSAQDLWAQYRILSPSILGRSFWNDFMPEYFEDRNARMPKETHFPDWQLQKGAAQRLNARIMAHSHVVLQSEELKLPPLIRQQIGVSLPPAARAAYRQMEDTFLTTIDGATCQTDLVLTQLLRLQQIVSGILPTDTGLKELPCAKLDALSELLEDAAPKEKIIVWSCFVPTYAAIASLCTELKLAHVFLTGGQKPKERQAAIDAFNQDPKVRVMIGNQAAGIGIGLQAASVMVYYAKSYNLEHDLQSEARAWRGGSEIHERILRIDLVTRGTVEERITDALAKKVSLSELILGLKSDIRRAA